VLAGGAYWIHRGCLRQRLGKQVLFLVSIEQFMSERTSQKPLSITQPEQTPEMAGPQVSSNYLVHQVEISRPLRRLQRLRGGAARFLLPPQMAPGWHGYGLAVLGVALASGCIALINRFVHISNVSLVYLLVVLLLAAAFGRGPALLASVLAFVAYDFLFIPPLYRFTIYDPTEWLSLSALLATALVLGQLTAALQVRAREARESQQRTATLYALAQLIASTADELFLLDALAHRLVEVFASAGVAASALLLPDEQRYLTLRASAPLEGTAGRLIRLATPEQMAAAKWAFRHGAAVSFPSAPDQVGIHTAMRMLYLPLQSSQQVVGVLGIAGAARIEHLAGNLPVRQPSGALRRVVIRQPDPQVELFQACCDQIALALERAALQQQAIHTEALRESNHLKDVLLGSVTHDLRTPLASIRAAASSLLEPGVTWSEAERHELLEAIDSSGARLDRLVSNLLDLSRLEAGVASPQRDWHLIGEVIAAVLDRLDLAGQLKGRAVQVGLPDELPLVPMDHEQIEQVLTNLIENALKYSPAESLICIHAQVNASSGELEVRVSDQGIGIPASELEAIFTKFYRVKQVRLPWAQQRPPIGTGLGLTICANIIQAHGGRIWAESQPGHGATFIFTLPIPAGGPANGTPDQPLAHEPATAPPEVAT
jgi:two-component system sensor histidine kinase KdpD